MGKISRSSKLLKEINNLEQNCSDTEYDESDLVESENEYPVAGEQLQQIISLQVPLATKQLP